MACLCGDPLCPSCGTAQGTYRAPRRVPAKQKRPVPTFGASSTTSTRDQKRALYYSRVAQHAVSDALWAIEQVRHGRAGASWLQAPVHAVCWAVSRAFVAAHGGSTN